MKLKTAIVATALAALFTAYGCSVSSRLKEERQKPYNIIAIQADSACDKNGAFDKFGKKFVALVDTFKQAHPELNVNYAIKTLPCVQVLPNNNDQAYLDYVSKTIDSVLTDFAQTNGPIDRAFVGAHGRPGALELRFTRTPLHINYNCNYGTNHKIPVHIQSEDILKHANNNPKAKKLFKEDGLFVVLSCDGAREDEDDTLSVAQAFHLGYGVTSVGVNHKFPSYSSDGGLSWDPVHKEITLPNEFTFERPYLIADIYKDSLGYEYVVHPLLGVLNKTTDEFYFPIESKHPERHPRDVQDAQDLLYRPQKALQNGFTLYKENEFLEHCMDNVYFPSMPQREDVTASKVIAEDFKEAYRAFKNLF